MDIAETTAGLLGGWAVVVVVVVRRGKERRENVERESECRLDIAPIVCLNQKATLDV